MPEVNPKNAERWVNSYFDSPYTAHLGFGALGAAGMWVVGALDIAFGQPPWWVYVASGAGVAGVTYAVDATVSSLARWLSSDE